MPDRAPEGPAALVRPARTWIRENGKVAYKVRDDLADIPQALIGTPTYKSLPLDQYFSTMRFPNAITRLWLDMR